MQTPRTPKHLCSLEVFCRRLRPLPQLNLQAVMPTGSSEKRTRNGSMEQARSVSAVHLLTLESITPTASVAPSGLVASAIAALPLLSDCRPASVCCRRTNYPGHQSIDQKEVVTTRGQFRTRSMGDLQGRHGRWRADQSARKKREC